MKNFFGRGRERTLVVGFVALALILTMTLGFQNCSALKSSSSSSSGDSKQASTSSQDPLQDPNAKYTRGKFDSSLTLAANQLDGEICSIQLTNFLVPVEALASYIGQIQFLGVGGKVTCKRPDGTNIVFTEPRAMKVAVVPFSAKDMSDFFGETITVNLTGDGSFGTTQAVICVGKDCNRWDSSYKELKYGGKYQFAFSLAAPNHCTDPSCTPSMMFTTPFDYNPPRAPEAVASGTPATDEARYCETPEMQAAITAFDAVEAQMHFKKITLTASEKYKLENGTTLDPSSPLKYFYAGTFLGAVKFAPNGEKIFERFLTDSYVNGTNARLDFALDFKDHLNRKESDGSWSCDLWHDSGLWRECRTDANTDPSIRASASCEEQGYFCSLTDSWENATDQEGKFGTDLRTVITGEWKYSSLNTKWKKVDVGLFDTTVDQTFDQANKCLFRVKYKCTAGDRTHIQTVGNEIKTNFMSMPAHYGEWALRSALAKDLFGIQPPANSDQLHSCRLRACKSYYGIIVTNPGTTKDGTPIVCGAQ